MVAAFSLVTEQADGNLPAYSPDLPGCVAAGATVTEVRERVEAAIAFRIADLTGDGLPIPERVPMRSTWP